MIFHNVILLDFGSNKCNLNEHESYCISQEFCFLAQSFQFVLMLTRLKDPEQASIKNSRVQNKERKKKNHLAFLYEDSTGI